MRVGSDLGAFEIDSLPGCSQIAVSHSAFLFPEFRGRGNGSPFTLDRLNYIRSLGYDAALCTVSSTNAKEIHLLLKHGWQQVAEYVSRKTGNTVQVFFISFPQSKIKGYWEWIEEHPISNLT